MQPLSNSQTCLLLTDSATPEYFVFECTKCIRIVGNAIHMLKSHECHITFARDLMAQRLARRAEDREVPGSSPTQD